MKVLFRTLTLVSLSSFVVAVSKISESRKLVYLAQPCWLLNSREPAVHATIAGFCLDIFVMSVGIRIRRYHGI